MKRFVFLDRDGVIVKFPGIGKYVVRDSQMKLIPRAAEAIALLTKAGYPIALISNQGCVSHGMVTRAALKRMTQTMMKQVRAAGGRIGQIHYCLHQSADKCRCKKPQTLMLKRAWRGRGIPKKHTYFVGDSDVDVEAGKNFGCHSVLVLSGRNKKRDVKRLAVKPDFVKKDLWETAQWLTKKRS